MCGILTIVRAGQRPVSVSDETAARMRDTLSRRGPDGAGMWREGPALLAHRRLAVIAPAGNPQPLAVGAADDPDRLVVAFNGELYEPDRVRAALRSAGRIPRGSTDTELVGLALAEWGADAFIRLRGMFAIAAWFPQRQELLVGRDALGIVPLVWAAVPAVGGPEIVVASEARAILAHPAMPIRPDWTAVGHYLNGLRLTMGERTMFAGVSTVLPGSWLRIRCRGDRPDIDRGTWWTAPAEDRSLQPDEAATLIQTAMGDSVRAHLLSDVPLCALLSGGLDSTIVAAEAAAALPSLRTFCAGATPSADDDDLSVARRIAAALGTDHRDVPISAAGFLDGWTGMVQELGVPLCTPNEVAIHAVAAALKPFATVALSGEGADELFAGYGPALEQCEAWIAASRQSAAAPVEEWHASTFGWVPLGLLNEMLEPGVAEQANPSATLEFLRCTFASAGDPSRLRTHLDVQRRLNLPSLLHRLNTATMLAGVEGRTPFADVRIAELAARIPCSLHRPAAVDAPPTGEGGLAVATLPRTKRTLRSAYLGRVPDEAVLRPKASFPLPFEQWIGGASMALEGSAVRSVLRPEAIAFVTADPQRTWRLAWPVLNLGLWLQRWWG